MSNNKFKYDFFISYRHADPDTDIASYLHKLLEQYKIPKEIQKKSGKTKISRVFRDEDELSASSDLSQDIREQLSNSEYLIVVCSPNTRKSRWVEQEIRTFLEVRDGKHILPVLIEGEPEDSFPDILLETEPMAADFRGSTKKDIRKRCKAELLRLVAPALYCSYDELKQRHKAYQMKRFAIGASIATVITLLFFSYSAYQSIQIAKNYREKQINQARLLADKSQQLLESSDREAALLVALEALPQSESDENMPLVGDAQLALENALYLYSLPENNGYYADRILHMQNYAHSKYDLDKESRILATCDKQNIIYFWDLNSKDLITTYNLHNRNLTCQEVYLLPNHISVICTTDLIIGFDYKNNTVIWEWSSGEEFPYYGHIALSPDKNILAIGDTDYILDNDNNIEYYIYIYYIDLSNGTTIQTSQTLTHSGHSATMDNIFWAPDNNQVFLEISFYEDEERIYLYKADYSANAITYYLDLLLDPDGQIDYNFANDTDLVYVYTGLYPSFEYYFPILDYQVQSININTKEVLWTVEGSGTSRDRSPQISFLDVLLDDGSTDTITTVNVYSEVINIFQGEVISESNYNERITAAIPMYPIQIHLSENGILYQTNIANGLTINPDYGRTDLGVKDIMAVEQISESELIVLKEGSGDIYLFNQKYDDSGILFEDSETASHSAIYNETGTYVMDLYSDYENNHNTFTVWDANTGAIYYQESFDSIQYEDIQSWGFLENDLIYCATSYYIRIYSLTEKKQVAEYNHNTTNMDPLYYDEIYSLSMYHSDEFGFLFMDGEKNLICLSGIELKQTQLLSSESIQDIIDYEPVQEYDTFSLSSLKFLVSPSGTYIAMYNTDAEMKVRKLHLWNCSTQELMSLPDINIYHKSYDSYTTLAFSNDETHLLVYDSEQRLHSIDLTTGNIKDSISLDGDIYRAFQYSTDNRYIYIHTYDHLLKVYDTESHTYTMITDEVPYDITQWKFYDDDQYLLIETDEFLSYPIQYMLRRIDNGEYEVFSSAGPSADGNLNHYLILDDDNYMYQYKRPDLDEMLQKAREILEGRELTEMEKQKYNIES